MAKVARQLADLISIGPAMLRDFELLGIRSVAHLARQNPRKLYEKLGRVARQHQDILRAGRVLRGRGAGAESAAGCGEVPVVVVE